MLSPAEFGDDPVLDLVQAQQFGQHGRAEADGEGGHAVQPAEVLQRLLKGELQEVQNSFTVAVV